MANSLFRKKSITNILREAEEGLTDGHGHTEGLKRVLKVRDLTFLGIAAVIGTGVFTAADIAIVKSIGGDIEKEIVRVNDNGEAAIKQRYLKILDAILKMINTIP